MFNNFVIECQEKEMNIKRQLSSPKDENDGKKGQLTSQLIS